MDPTLRAALGRQFGAAIDMLERAVVACPAGRWTQRLWPNRPGEPRPSWEPAEFAEFWFVAYHTLFWLDLYLSGCREADFTPPAPFAWVEIDDAPPLARPYTKQELLAISPRRAASATRRSRA